MRLVPLRRTLIAIVLALAWCWGAWHDDLEGAGWMFAHKHHCHEHAADGPSTPSENSHPASDDHLPVWARDFLRLIGFAAGIAAVVLLARGRMGALFGLPSGRPERRSASPPGDSPFRTIWHFLLRCAPPTVAPPALG